MFGTIGRFQPKSGHSAAIATLVEEWQHIRRPSIPGLFVALHGQPVDHPSEFVVVIATQDEATYRALAASPEQDIWYRRLLEHLETEPAWEDVIWQTLQANVIGADQTE